MTSLCVIPARGGSKRIPGKNIRDFLGKPIIAYSIYAAMTSSAFDDVMVSTDDRQIAAVAREYGASVPFMRSAETSDDHSGLAEVLAEVLAQYEQWDKWPDVVCCVLPTAPLIRSEDIARAMKTVADQASAVVPVVRYSYPIQRALQISGTGTLSMVWPEHRTSRSQDLVPRFHDAGQFYVIKSEVLKQQQTLFPEGAVALELPAKRVQDIDTEEDWLIAEHKMRFLAEGD